MSRRFRVLLLAILAAAGALRLFRLGYFSYGLDEILQAYWINGTWAFFWKSLRFDAFHPPLDYLVGKLVESFHPSDAARKIPAVLWGVGTLAAFGALLARRASESAGLVAAALLAAAPFHVRYSQELRPYSLSLFLLCLALLLLDRFLERPGAARLAALFLACLGAAYTLYTAALVLGLAAAGLVLEDAWAPLPDRRRAARRFLAWSPLFVLALWLAYLPWWPVFLEASRRPAMAARAPLTFARASRILSYFAFAGSDGDPLGPGGLFFLALVAAGAVLALSTRGWLFLAVWALGGFAAIEILGQVHPHFDVSRRFLPAAPGMTALAALCLAALLARPVTRLAGAVLLAAVLVLDARGLRLYFRQGRADWRVLADYLKRESATSERIFTENQYAQLCTAFYVAGPQWLYQVMEKAGTPARDFPNLEGQVERLQWSWKPGTRAWLVLAGQPEAPDLRRWAEIFPAVDFPRSEGARLRRLDPALRDRALPPR